MITPEQGRYFLQDSIRQEVDFRETAQSRGLPPPPVEKPYDPAARRVALPQRAAWQSIGDISVVQAIAQRESRRAYSGTPLTIEELSFLLWATQGVRAVSRRFALRTVPSAGARHAFETYLAVLNGTGLDSGLYRYLPLEHELVFECGDPDLGAHVARAALGQSFAAAAAVVFIWTALPARMEWRYGAASYKVLAIDAGHVCQNLYLACEAVGAGTCAIAAYDQAAADCLVRVDGQDEFVVYMAPVGKRE